MVQLQTDVEVAAVVEVVAAEVARSEVHGKIDMIVTPVIMVDSLTGTDTRDMRALVRPTTAVVGEVVDLSVRLKVSTPLVSVVTCGRVPAIDLQVLPGYAAN
jgi:uncharacterized membrane protein